MRIEQVSIKRRNAGFTLIELAAVLMVSGFTMAMTAQAVKQYTLTARNDRTEENMKLSYDAIEEHFFATGVYPCPADPTLAPDDPNYGVAQCRSTKDQEDNPDNCIGNPSAGITCISGSNAERDADGNGKNDVIMIGAIPFRTLSDTDLIASTPFFEANKVDGFGTLLTYAVTENMTNNNKYNLVSRVSPHIGAIQVVDENDIDLTIPASSAHFVVFSHGDNARGGYNKDGLLIDSCQLAVIVIPGGPPSPPVGKLKRDIENCERKDATFRLGIRSTADNDDYYDDKLLYKSTGISPLWDISSSSPPTEYYIYNTNLGNVGVGTQTPTDSLHILGDISTENRVMGKMYCNQLGEDCMDASIIAGTGVSCGNTTQVAYAIQENQLVCRDVSWTVPAKSCPPNTFMRGFSNKGGVLCCPKGGASASCSVI